MNKKKFSDLCLYDLYLFLGTIECGIKVWLSISAAFCTYIDYILFVALNNGYVNCNHFNEQYLYFVFLSLFSLFKFQQNRYITSLDCIISSILRNHIFRNISWLLFVILIIVMM